LKNIYKFYYLLDNKQRVQLFYLSILLFIGMLLEMFSLGAILPLMKIMVDPEKSLDVFNQGANLYKFIGLNKKQITLFIISSLIILYIFKSLFLIYLGWKQAHFSANLTAQISSKLFYYYLSQDYSFHINRNSSHLLRNVQNETTFLNAITLSAITVSIEFTVLVGVSITLFIIEPIGASILILILLLPSIIINILTKKKLKNWGQLRQQYDGMATQHLMQGLNGIKEVILLGLNNFFLNKFILYSRKKANVYVKQITLQQFPRIYLELLAVITMATCVLYININNIKGDNFIVILGLFTVGAFRIIPSFSRISGSMQVIRFNISVVDLLYNEFKTLKLGSNENLLINKNSSFQFKKIKIENLSFKYDNSSKSVLSKINIDIVSGDMIGFVGPSGSGKSTLIDIIMGLLRPQYGDVTVDGSSIFKLNRTWQSNIGYVPQNIYLTDDTFRRNIAFGIPDEQIDENRVIYALKIAQLSDLITQIENGLDTVVGERGIKLSGGQRQRIGIARAIYFNPKILVLDEATSALDVLTEKEIMESLISLKGIITILIIAHRISTVMSCDKIYVIEEGKIIKNGLPVEIF
jgi:ABC-type multidrug transport system fused ATPase/permease subunit